MITANEKVYPVVEMVEGVAVASDDERGITIRQYYAGLAMQGLLAAYKISAYSHYMDDALLSKESVKYANSLINELNKTELP